MRYLIIFILIIGSFFSCESYRIGIDSRSAKIVSENFSREYTRLDTLIRIDGYYYHEDGTRLISPFIMSNNREFQILYVRYESHIQIQEKFGNNTPTARGKGSYTLSGDTIKVRWAMPYQIGCYHIYSEQYVIENDTTLRRIFHLCETDDPRREKSSPARNDIYKFYKYQW